MRFALSTSPQMCTFDEVLAVWQRADGERRTLPLVARYADHWNYPGTAADPIAELHRLRGVLALACAEIGRDPASIRVSTLLFFGRSPEADVLELARRYRDAGVDLALASMPKPLRPDDVERIAELLAAL